jgi:hypothetical protein
LSECVFVAYGDDGIPILERRMAFPRLPERAELERLRRALVDPQRCRYAVVRAGRAVHALYLADDLVPQSVIRVGPRRGKQLRWLTSALPLDGGLRGFCGPEMFVRQADLGGVDAWLAPLLVGFVQDVPVRRHQIGWEGLYEWEYRGERYFYRSRRQQWSLYGAGNSPADNVARALRGVSAVEEFLWEIGALRLRVHRPGS